MLMTLLPLTQWAKLLGGRLKGSTCNMTTSSYEAGFHSIAYVTAPSRDVARSLAKGAIVRKLAACVNIVPECTSVYYWKDEVNEDDEVLMMIKTRTAKVPELIEFIKSNHPYEVCEVITTKIENGNPDYLSWISSTVPDVTAK